VRILIVEDDPLLGEGLVAALKRHGYTADWLQDGAQAISAVASEQFDLLLLDLGLPRLDGYAVLSAIRSSGNRLPVLVLTARDQVADRVRGLDLGADDYLVKPFDLNELLARIRALHRRAQGQTSNAIVHGDLRLDPAAHLCIYKGKVVDLPRREFALLRCLIENAGRVLTRDAVVQRVYGWDESLESNALEVHVHHLRKKLYPDLIRTIRGVGYLVEAPVLPDPQPVGS
jgi:two-component system, OmpR family, response regulator QseB